MAQIIGWLGGGGMIAFVLLLAVRCLALLGWLPVRLPEWWMRRPSSNRDMQSVRSTDMNGPDWIKTEMILIWTVTTTESLMVPTVP